MAQKIAIHDEEAQKFIKNAIEKAKRIFGHDRAYIAVLSSLVFQDVIDHFDKEEGPKGKWQKWSTAYTEHMKAIGHEGNKILQDTGKLRNGFMPSRYRNVSEGILWYNPVSYAQAHDEGTNKLPQREFMWMHDKTLEDISTVTLNYLFEK